MKKIVVVMLLTIAFLCSGVFNTNKNTAQAVAQNKCQAEYARPATEEALREGRRRRCLGPSFGEATREQ